MAKTVDQLLEATSEINSFDPTLAGQPDANTSHPTISARISFKPDEQLLEKGTEHEFKFSGSATKVDDETLKVVPTDWFTGDDPNYVYDIIRKNDKDAVVNLYIVITPPPELAVLGIPTQHTIVFSGRFDDFSEESGFTLKGTPVPNEDFLSELPDLTL